MRLRSSRASESLLFALAFAAVLLALDEPVPIAAHAIGVAGGTPRAWSSTSVLNGHVPHAVVTDGDDGDGDDLDAEPSLPRAAR